MSRQLDMWSVDAIKTVDEAYQMVTRLSNVMDKVRPECAAILLTARRALERLCDDLRTVP